MQINETSINDCELISAIVRSEERHEPTSQLISNDGSILIIRVKPVQREAIWTSNIEL